MKSARARAVNAVEGEFETPRFSLRARGGTRDIFPRRPSDRAKRMRNAGEALPRKVRVAGRRV